MFNHSTRARKRLHGHVPSVPDILQIYLLHRYNKFLPPDFTSFRFGFRTKMFDVSCNEPAAILHTWGAWVAASLVATFTTSLNRDQQTSSSFASYCFTNPFRVLVMNECTLDSSVLWLEHVLQIFPQCFKWSMCNMFRKSPVWNGISSWAKLFKIM